ncbi:MAG: N-terminal cleavage protein [Akkermansiaceae bacterium]|nr:N-terminal cleavage protein [Akkermansiaceae bacterium]
MRYSHAGKRQAGGFTLVELLVVIVIIVALAALSFGIGKKAITKSRLTASSNKCRDMGVRMGAYSSDHAGLLPVYRFEDDNLYWWGVLVTDPKNDSELEIFHSPNDKEFKVKQIEKTISYAWNVAVMGKTDGAAPGSEEGQKRMANFNDPNRVLVLCDGPKGGHSGQLESTTLPDEKRYDGKVAALFLDGTSRLLDIEGEFKNNDKWFKNPDKKDGE